MAEAEEQLAVCRRFGVEPMPSSPELKAGVSHNVKEGRFPVHGMRCQPDGETTGWYVYCEPRSDDPDFFAPVHVKHLRDWCPIVIPYLQLPPGWRFTLAPGYEDAWFDDEFARHQGIAKQPSPPSVSPLRRQVDQLDPAARGALEGALGLAYLHHHCEIALPHLLIKLIESSALVREAIVGRGLDTSDLIQTLENRFPSIPAKAGVVPALSPDVSQTLDVATNSGAIASDCLGLFSVILSVPDLRERAVLLAPGLALVTPTRPTRQN